VIAVGADETVMSPGTQMMIHCTSTIVWGNAADMRKEAAVLEGLDRSLAEIYTTKAGQKDWASLLEAETWLTAADAVDEGLADRVAVIPDAGEAETVGDEDVIVVVPDEEDPEEEDAARVIRFAQRPSTMAAAAAHEPPVSTEPGSAIRKENVVAYDDFKAGIRERLGMTDADATDEAVLAALDETLAEQAEATPVATIPAGTTLIEDNVLAELRDNAKAGAEARAQQVKDRRDGIITAALNEGRITAAAAPNFRAMLDADETAATATINSLAKNTVPVAEIGHTAGEVSAEDAIYASAWGADEKEA
jgi:hypothetical protein